MIRDRTLRFSWVSFSSRSPALGPRVLIDYDANPPHKRNHVRLVELRRHPDWPRLRAFFDEGFTIAIQDRIPDFETFQRRIVGLDQSFADAEMAEELQRLNLLASDPDIANHHEVQGRVSKLSERFLTRVRDILHGANVELDVEERISPSGRDASLTINVHLPNVEWPHSHVQHTISFRDSTWLGEFTPEVGQPIGYLKAPAETSKDEIDRCIGDSAQRVAKNLVRHLNYQLHRAPELRKNRNRPSTPLSDLAEQYPVGIEVIAERKHEGRHRLHLRFQNNSGIVQPATNLLVLVPIPLNAEIAGDRGEIQEEKYNRFVIDYPDLNLPDRGIAEGPTIELTVPPAMPGDTHLFFRIVAGDSQVTKSPKLTDVVSQD